MPVVTHKVERPDGTPLPGIPGRISQNPPGLWEGDDRHLLHVDVTTDTTGAFTVTLPESAALTPAGSNYQLTMLGETLSFVVPPGGPHTIHDNLVDPPGTVDQSALSQHIAQHPAGTPASTVATETSFGQASAVGTGTAFARNDHTHGTPSLGTTGTTAAAGNHAHAGVYDPAGTAAAAVTTHEAAGNPHPTYATDSDLTTHAGTQHTGVKAAKAVPVTSGDISIVTGSWQAVGPDISIPATAGDLIQISPAFLTNGTDAEADAATIISGNPNRYLSSGTSTQRTNGFGGWYSSGTFDLFAPPACIQVQAGDIDTGQVTVRIIAKTPSGTRTFKATTADYIGMITVVNLGPATA